MENLKIGQTSLKCALFSSTFFIILLASKEGLEVFPFWFITFIITFVISFMMIVITIVPFYQIVNPINKEIFFKKYFPIYAIIFFISCLVLLIQNQFKELSIQIITTAFLTAMLSWVWLFESEPLKETA